MRNHTRECEERVVNDVSVCMYPCHQVSLDVILRQLRLFDLFGSCTFDEVVDPKLCVCVLDTRFSLSKFDMLFNSAACQTDLLLDLIEHTGLCTRIARLYTQARQVRYIILHVSQDHSPRILSGIHHWSPYAL